MEDIFSLPPFLPFLIAGLLHGFLPRYGQRALQIGAPVAALFGVLGLSWDGVFPIALFDTTIQLLALNPFSRLFGVAFCVAAFAAVCIGLKTAKRSEMTATLLLASGGLGVVFAGDLIALVLFWELLMGASLYLIYCGGMKASRAAAARYLVMHLFGSACLLAGAAGIVMDSGISAFPSFALDWAMPHTPTEWAAWLMVIGVLVNVAALPFSAWLPDSYPSASLYGMLPLSVFTTKAAVFMLMELFAGSPVLIPIGLATLLYGVLLALMQSHIRRLIAYTMLAQLGLMTLAVGLGSEAALTGVALLAVTHIGYNGVLVAATAHILRETGKHTLLSLKGFYHAMPRTAWLLLVASAMMAAAPFTGSYVAKRLITDSLHAFEWPLLYWLTVGALGVGTYLLLPWFLLFGKAKEPTKKLHDAPKELLFGSSLLLALSFLPLLYSYGLSEWLGVGAEFTLFDPLALAAQLCLLGGAGAAFYLLRPHLKREKGVVLDIDVLYRQLLPQLSVIFSRAWRVLEQGGGETVSGWRKALFSTFHHNFSEGGPLVRPQAIGRSVFLLLLLLIIAFISMG